MAKFLFTYRAQQDYTLGRPETTAPWRGWFDSMGGSLVDLGEAVVESSPLGNLGADTRLGGYSVVTADNLEAAMAIAKGCPVIAQGGGIEAGVLLDREGSA
jgi:hypothetical protein